MKKTILFVMALELVLIASVANADYIFGTPTNLGPTVNSWANEWGSWISADGLELYFASSRSGGSGGPDLWVAMRATTDEDWTTPVNLGSTVNSSDQDSMPSISSDGLELYFQSLRSGGSGDSDIWVTTRATKNDPWEEPVNLGPTVNSSSADGGPSITADGLTLYFISLRPGGYGSSDLWVTTRATTSDPWGEPVNLGPIINSSVGEWYSCQSADGLMLFVQDNNLDICLTQRKSTEEPFGPAVKLPPHINTSRNEGAPSVSSDGSTLYFSSNRSGGYGSNDIWQASINPIVDFNGDGFVNTDDLLIMIDNWSTDNSLCDIGPMSWGDGIVDREDVEVLMGYWGQEIYDPTLIAHWALDEVEGDIAYDSTGEHDGTVNGEPVWQPEGGMINGALELDGTNDYISTPRVIEIQPEPFSVFAWVQGGAPGQVILSQANRSDWLAANATDGSLMTELRFLTKPAVSLLSQSVITDGQWHRIGLVWDGSSRILYVDDVEVASDAYEAGMLSGDLQIGAGNKLEEGSYWSGLIDDVRIYNRVITP